MVIQRIFRKLFQKSRLNDYQNMLELALNNGYIITSLSDWYENDFYSGKKVLVLRHDVDLLPSTAYRMFLIEKKLGVKSTFYFRWFTANQGIIKEIINEGFEVSLHFETLATFCKKNRIFKQEKITNEVILNCIVNLKNEIKTFQERFGKIKTLCSHGDKRNRMIGISNHRIIDNISREELGIYFETYDKEIISKFDVYASDSSINENHIWKYGTSPREAINSGIQSICILTHPHHWHYNLKINILRIVLEIKDNITFLF